MKTYLKLKEIFNEASLTSDIAGILHWDMATMMPSSSRDQRSEQLAYLSKLSHGKISSSEVGDLIEDSKKLNLNNSDKKNLNAISQKDSKPEITEDKFLKETAKPKKLSRPKKVDSKSETSSKDVEEKKGFDSNHRATNDPRNKS